MDLIPARSDDSVDIISLLLRRVDALERLGASRWGGVEAWHYVGAGGEPAFQNSWVNRGGTTRTTRFRKVGDVVRIEGGVSTGANGTTIFTLPVGYRPQLDVVMSIRLNDAGELLAYLYIQPNGTISPNATGTVGGISAVDFFVDFSVT